MSGTSIHDMTRDCAACVNGPCGPGQVGYIERVEGGEAKAFAGHLISNAIDRTLEEIVSVVPPWPQQEPQIPTYTDRNAGPPLSERLNERQRRPHVCPRCGGEGGWWEFGVGEKTCHPCGGTGIVWEPQR